MLASLRLKLDAEDFDYRRSSLMQGVMFEHIDPDYAADLHQAVLHPYSQFVSRHMDEETIWHLNTTSDEAYEKIIKPLLDAKFDSFQMQHLQGREIHILEKSFNQTSTKSLFDEFKNKPGEKYITVQFFTPTAFKSRGRYAVIPDLRLIYQALMMKYSAASPDMNMMDQDTLGQLTQYSFLSSYRLNTSYFPMEGKKIPGFIGTVTITMDGPELLARYIRLLFRFGEYSGVGIKTGMGMGAIQIIEGGLNGKTTVRTDHRRTSS